VEVDVYRSLGAKRAEPLPGCSSFFQVLLLRLLALRTALLLGGTAEAAV